MMRRLLAVLLVLCPLCASAQAAPAKPDIALEQRLKLLETELRCLVCQNQTLAESPAGLADDLRREIRTLAQQGKSDAEIKEFLQARYGDFILYRPPVKQSTWLLWGGPFGLLLLGAVVFALIVRKRGALPAQAAPDEAAHKRAQDLLSAEEEKDDVPKS